MPDPIPVADPDDDRLADYRQLTDVALRRRIEPAFGLFVAEGELVVRRAVAAGYRPRSLLVLDRFVPAMSDVAQATGAPLYAAGRAVLASLTGFDVHRGVLASMARRPVPTPAEIATRARRVAVLEDLNNPTNVGAVFRSAAGLGMDAVLLSPRCADPLYRRSVRVSMGAVFAVRYARAERWPGALGDLRDAGFAVLALTPGPDARPLDRLDLPADRPVALLLGAEGPGLTPGALAHADQAVRIPMQRDVDSLNAASAAAVAFYAVGLRS